MSLLQDEQLETIERQGRRRKLYSVEFFLTVLVSIFVAGWVVSSYVPEGVSSIPVVFEAIMFAVVIALLSAPWSGRLMPLLFVGALAAFIYARIQTFGTTDPPTTFGSIWVWIYGVGLLLLILLGWKIVSGMSADNREAREYEKQMRAEGRWQ